MLNNFIDCPICHKEIKSNSYKTLANILRCKNPPFVSYDLFKKCHFCIGPYVEEIYINNYIISFTKEALVIYEVSKDKNSYDEIININDCKLQWNDFFRLNSDANLAIDEFVKNYKIIC